MSEYGVSETKELFWSCFAGGKNFAKRSSWYDMMFMGMGSMVMGRDESMVEFLLRWGIQVRRMAWSIFLISSYFSRISVSALKHNIQIRTYHLLSARSYSTSHLAFVAHWWASFGTCGEWSRPIRQIP
jgi:hypothetical protein